MMLPTAYDLHEYYKTPQGRAVRLAISNALQQYMPENENEAAYIIGMGYALPYLEDLAPLNALPLALLPTSMGAMHWPFLPNKNNEVQAVLISRSQWPLPPASADIVIIAHELEYAEDPAAILDEAWRTLKPEGRLLLIAPNRRAPWARSENSPFGHGRPFSSSQLYDLLRERHFTLENMQGALLAPPFKGLTYNRRIMPIIERLAPYCPPLCGVVLADARKRLFSPISGKPRPISLMPSPAPSFASAGLSRSKACPK